MRAIYNVIGLSLCIQGYIHTSNNDVKTPAACVILEFVSNNINPTSSYSIPNISIFTQCISKIVVNKVIPTRRARQPAEGHRSGRGTKGILLEGVKNRSEMDRKVSFITL